MLSPGISICVWNMHGALCIINNRISNDSQLTNFLIESIVYVFICSTNIYMLQRIYKLKTIPHIYIIHTLPMGQEI